MEPIHYDNPDWPAGSWEEMGLEVCAILKSGGWQKLTPDNYIITGFDSQTPGEKEIISVYAKDDPEKSVEFPIIILDSKTGYRSVSSYQGAGGKIIPYPSKVPLGSDTTVSLHIYADNGYVLDGGSLKIETAKGGSAAYKAEGGVYTFTMPDSDVTLSAKFINSEAKLESGGSATYYEHLKDAVKAAQSAGAAGGGGAITLLKTPVYIDETITITSGNDITLASGLLKEQEIHWGGLAVDNMTSMIKVESGASLTLDGTGGELIIDGAERAKTAKLVTVAGDLAMKGGVTLKNSKGGGVFVDGGEFTMSGGEISGNTAAGSGGGVYVSSGEFTMSGGEISGNTAGSGGGGVFVNNGTFTMSGGAVSGNTAELGAGVYTNGGFNMSGAAFVAQDNVVYLEHDGQIKVTGMLAPSLAAPNLDGGKSAKIEISSPSSLSDTVSRKILNRTDGDLTESDIAKFTFDTAVGEIKAAGGGGWLIPAGFEAFTSGASITACKTLSEAVAGAPSGDSVITLLKETITFTNTVNIANGKNITFTVQNGETYTIKRASSSMTAALFAVASGASLTLDGSGGGMIIDGADAGAAALISVTGAFAMKDGVTLKGGKKGGVAVNNGGEFTMSGGEISGNTAETTSGGGVYIESNGKFNMSDGTISGNTATVYGGGVYIESNGKFDMSGGEISGNGAVGFGGGGVYVAGGEFTMSGGTIGGNAAESTGGGVCVKDSGEFTMSGGEINWNTATFGGGVYVSGSEFTMSGGTIGGNTATSLGTGVHGAFTKTGDAVILDTIYTPILN
jgi:hypothetical protein